MPFRSVIASRMPAPATTRTSPRPLRIGVIGAGRVGAVVGAALAAAGHHVVATAPSPTASRERAARLLPGRAAPAGRRGRGRCDLLLLAVPDDALARLVAGLAGHRRHCARASTSHTSGRHGLAVLAPPPRPAPSRWRCTRR